MVYLSFVLWALTLAYFWKYHNPHKIYGKCHPCKKWKPGKELVPSFFIETATKTGKVVAVCNTCYAQQASMAELKHGIQRQMDVQNEKRKHPPVR